MAELQERTEIFESTINHRPIDVVEGILARSPRIVALSVHIWSASISLEVVRLLKGISPNTTLVLGGPEVSYETEQQEICRLADFVVTLEGDLAFPQLCRQILSGTTPRTRIVTGGRPPLSDLRLPYRYYSDEDLAQRTVYVEASRGCPFRCQFCLSSLDKAVRSFPLDGFLKEMQSLLDRGARHFKFIDRTFNLKTETSLQILNFFRERYVPGIFLHFEMIPDRFPEDLKPVIESFPPGVLQFEIGIQTFNPEVATRIERRQNYEKLRENLTFLRQQTGVHIHADLIAGLPGEDLQSFADGFDQLLALDPQEIQVGILKRLRGTPIIGHDDAWSMLYSQTPPYEILQTSVLSFEELQGLRRFSRYWDLLSNRGFFRETLKRILALKESPFWSFWEFTFWLYAEVGTTHKLGLPRLTRSLFDYLTEQGLPEEVVASLLVEDTNRDRDRPLPAFLRPYHSFRQRLGTQRPNLPARQQRHHSKVSTLNATPPSLGS